MFKALKKFVHRLWYPTPATTPAEQREIDSARLHQEIASLQATINDLKTTHEFSDLVSQATAFGFPNPTKEDKKAFVLSNTGEILEENNNNLLKKMIEVKKEGNEVAKFLDITHLLTHMNNEAKQKAEKGILVKWSPDSIIHKLTFDDKGSAEQKVYLEVEEPVSADTVHDFLPAGFNKVASTEVSGINVADVNKPVDSDPVKETEEDKSIDIIEVRDPMEILEKAHKARKAYHESIGRRVSEGSSYASHLSQALKDGSLSGRGAVFDGTDLTYWVPENEAEANLRKKLADKLDQDARRIKEEMELENAKWNWVEYGTYSYLDPHPPGLDLYVRTHPSKARGLEQVHPETGLYVSLDERLPRTEETPLEQQNPHPASQVWSKENIKALVKDLPDDVKSVKLDGEEVYTKTNNKEDEKA